MSDGLEILRKIGPESLRAEMMLGLQFTAALGVNEKPPLASL
jgi:hypothetical protein